MHISGVKYVATCLGHFPKLRVLDMGSKISSYYLGCDMGVDGMKAVAEQLKKMKFLEELNLHSNKTKL